MHNNNECVVGKYHFSLMPMQNALRIYTTKIIQKRRVFKIEIFKLKKKT